MIPLESLDRLLQASPYQAYLYGYPHKSAYRPFAQPQPLADLWAREQRQRLFLYLHVPFCEMRCGFCNLFTVARPGESLAAQTMQTLGREARRARAALEAAGTPWRFARVAVGGGTPTYLSEAALHALLDVAEETLGADLHKVPVCMETSPETGTADKLKLLVARGVDRISMGVQSFFQGETRAVNRPQDPAQAHATLDAIRHAGARTLNLDLMYGLPGQTPSTWLASLREALRHAPEEIYLYPLYVRPLTTLGRRARLTAVGSAEDLRLQLYRLGRDLLLSEGYTQVSMRMFRAKHAPPESGPAYQCQEDGMLGLGCGARSYTEAVHYSTDYAVTPRSTKQILADYVQRSDEDFDLAHHGFALSTAERARRYVIMSLLAEGGLDLAAYTARFGGEAAADLPELGALVERQLAHTNGGRLQLTPAGLERADAIGPWLHSPQVEALMDAYVQR